MNQLAKDDALNAIIKSRNILIPELYCQAGHLISKACITSTCRNSLRCDQIDCRYCGTDVHVSCFNITLKQMTVAINRKVNSFMPFLNQFERIDNELIKEVKQGQELIAKTCQYRQLDSPEQKLVDHIFRQKKAQGIAGKQVHLFCTGLFGHNESIKSKVSQFCKIYEETIRKMVRQMMELKKALLFKSGNLKSQWDSIILSGQPEVERINNEIFLNQILNKYRKIQLLYRGTRDGFSATAFHSKSDNFQNTLVLVKTEFGKTIGGFSKYSWNHVPNNYVHDVGRQAFLFSLDLKQKMVPKEDGRYLIYCSRSYGPRFGGGADLYIADDCNNNQKSYVNFPYTYNCEGSFQYVNGQSSYTAFSGALDGQFFRVEEFEVFHVVYDDNKPFNLDMKKEESKLPQSPVKLGQACK